jgi:CRISPR-associated protein (TIGR02710 family)
MILEAIDYAPQYQMLRLETEDSFEKIYQVIKARLPAWLESINVRPQDVYFNYTGGTKSMSAGLALAAVELLPNYVYVSGKREGDGLGVVISGTEQSITGRNPWFADATLARKSATVLLQQGQADGAARYLADAAVTASPYVQQRLLLWSKFCEVLAKQQLFDFRAAKSGFERIQSQLLLAIPSDAATLREFIEGMRAYLSSLEAESKPDFDGPRLTLLQELLQNADRCSLAGRYDDCVARLYRAVELQGQNGLAEIIPHASNGEIVKEKVGDQVFAWVMSVYPEARAFETGTGTTKIQLTLAHLYSFLAATEDPRFSHYQEVYQSSLRPALHARNFSILAHGVTPIAVEKVRTLRDALEHGLGLVAAPAYAWPSLDFEKLI